MSPQNYLGHLQKNHIDTSKYPHQMIPIDYFKQYMPALQSLLVRRNFLAYMYCSHYLPTHTNVPSNSFNTRLVPTLLRTDELHLNTRQNNLINLHLRHLLIPYQIISKALLTTIPWYVHALLYQISIGTLESSPFGLYVLISSLLWAIFVVSSFHILYPLCFLIFARRLLVGYWPKPLPDFDLCTASKITWKVLTGGDEDNHTHSETKCYMFVCIQRYYVKSHK